MPVDLSAELHVKSDANQVAYRRWRQAGLDRGWGIPDHEPGDGAHTAVRVVASPARREDPDLANAWVLKEMENDAALAEPREFDQGGSDEPVPGALLVQRGGHRRAAGADRGARHAVTTVRTAR